MKGNAAWYLAVIAAMGLLAGTMALSPAYGEVTLEVLNPRGEITETPTTPPVAPVTDLAGKTIGIYWNGKPGGINFWDNIEALLKQKVPAAKVIRYEGPFEPSDAAAAAMAKEVDTFLYGVGD